MKDIGRLLVLSLCVSGLSGCAFPLGLTAIQGSGVLVSETRELDVFQDVEFQGGGQLQVTVGGEPQVTIEVDDNLLEFVETAVDDGRLVIRTTRPIRSPSGLKVSVVTPQLNGVAIAGAADAEIRDVASDAFHLSIAGASAIRVSGTARELSLQISGSGDIDSQQLLAEEVAIRIAGSGKVRVHAARELSAHIAGSGDVQYLGAPRITQHIAGSGQVQPLPAMTPDAAEADIELE